MILNKSKELRKELKKNRKEEMGKESLYANTLKTILYKLNRIGFVFDKVSIAKEKSKIKINIYEVKEESLSLLIFNLLPNNLCNMYKGVKNKVSIDFECEELWLTEPLKINVTGKWLPHTYAIQEDLEDIVEAMEIVHRYNSSNEIQSKYTFLLLLKDSLDKKSLSDEVLEELKKDYHDTVDFIFDSIKQRLNNFIKRTYKEVIIELEYLFKMRDIPENYSLTIYFEEPLLDERT